jgi:hypothetical protein
MDCQVKGKVRNETGNDGNMKPVLIPASLYKKIETAIDSSDLVDETTVLQKFKLSKKTLCNYISSKRIPRSYYTIAFNKSRWFFLDKLLGLKSFFSGKKAA